MLEKCVEALKVAGPDAVIFLEPFGGFREWLGLQAARAALRILAVGDEPGELEHLEVLGDRGLGHLEGLGEFRDGGFAGSEARKDRPPSWIGERGKGGIQAIGRGHCITNWFQNPMVIYKANELVKPQSPGGNRSRTLLRGRRSYRALQRDRWDHAYRAAS